MTRHVNPRRQYHSSYRQRQALATRQRIIESARRLFARVGYASTTMESIARAAGVAVETVYADFGSKRAVLRGVVASVVVRADLAHHYGEAIAEPDPRKQLRLVAGTIRRLWEQAWDLIEILRKAGMAEPDVRATWRTGEKARMRRQGGLIRSLVRKRVLRSNLSGRHAAHILWALTGPDMYRLLVMEQQWPASQFERWLGDHLITTLLARIGRE